MIAISTDLLFPKEQICEMARHIPGARYHLIDSDFGHDGFLIEHQKLNTIILDLLDRRD